MSLQDVKRFGDLKVGDIFIHGQTSVRMRKIEPDPQYRDGFNAEVVSPQKYWYGDNFSVVQVREE